jgi:hypothetical protein
MKENEIEQTKKNRHSEAGGFFTGRLNQIKRKQQLPCGPATFL